MVTWAVVYMWLCGAEGASVGGSKVSAVCTKSVASDKDPDGAYNQSSSAGITRPQGAAPAAAGGLVPAGQGSACQLFAPATTASRCVCSVKPCNSSAVSQVACRQHSTHALSATFHTCTQCHDGLHKCSECISKHSKKKSLSRVDTHTAASRGSHTDMSHDGLSQPQEGANTLSSGYQQTPRTPPGNPAGVAHDYTARPDQAEPAPPPPRPRPCVRAAAAAILLHSGLCLFQFSLLQAALHSTVLQVHAFLHSSLSLHLSKFVQRWLAHMW